MAKVLLLNNTENYHSGCKAVIDFYRKQFCQHELSFHNSQTEFKDFDVVIVNGEGTMHHNAKAADHLLDQLIEAKHYGCRTLLVNTVWQHNPDFIDKLSHVDYISVRDIKSKKDIQSKIDRPVDLCIDYSYFVYKRVESSPKTLMLTAGNRMNYPNTKPKRPKISDIGEDSRADIFGQTWIELVDTLAQSRLFVTGRHHELYAACVARCPFVVLEGNSHKNSGLIETACVFIPCLGMDATAAEILEAIDRVRYYEEEYQRLFDFLENFPVPDLPYHAALV